jgi:hypothetical protein
VLAAADQELALAATRALATVSGEAAEAALIRALSRSELDVRVAAAEALGAVGTIAAVAPLRRTLASPVTGRGLGRTVRRAIATIQARVPGAAPGNVSLAEGETGQLSYPQDDRSGSLSFPVRADPGAPPPGGGRPRTATSRARREKA